MKFIQKQDINKLDFSVFLRDLSLTIDVNLKHMIEDTIIPDEEKKSKKKNYHKGKKKIVKKKDLIIQQQNIKRKKMKYEDDLKKIDFIFEKLDEENPFADINNLQSEEGKLVFKIKLLEYFWNNKKKYMHYIFLLYFNIQNEENAFVSNLGLEKEVNTFFRLHNPNIIIITEFFMNEVHIAS